jgi:chemotaxis signal transduction protein
VGDSAFVKGIAKIQDRLVVIIDLKLLLEGDQQAANVADAAAKQQQASQAS